MNNLLHHIWVETGLMGNSESSYDSSPEDLHYQQQQPPEPAFSSSSSSHYHPRDLGPTTASFHRHQQASRSEPEAPADSRIRTKHRSRIADSFDSLDGVLIKLHKQELMFNLPNGKPILWVHVLWLYYVLQVVSALREAGLESSNLILGIDFTKSNEWTGNPSNSLWPSNCYVKPLIIIINFYFFCRQTFIPQKEPPLDK